MLVNPDIREWFGKLEGQPFGAGGGGGIMSPRPVSGLATGVTSGIIQPQRVPFGFNAPAIAARYQPQPITPYTQPRGMMPQTMAPLGGGGGARDLGGGAIAAGLGKLGAGAESALKAIGDAQRAKQADLTAAQGANAPLAFRTAPLPPGRPGAPLPPDRPAAPLPVARPVTPPIAPTFPPIGTASNTPAFAQGGGQAQTIPPIGGGGAALPTLAQGAPASGMTAEQFLQGIKVGEGVPYSGQSPTGAIGAYGLTGNFIKQYAPGAGLPTDRASYMNNPALQDQLATYAANRMYNYGEYPGGHFPNATGDWGQVANGWLAGSPHGASQPGNMTSQSYVNKVMNAANAAGPGLPSPSSSPSAQAYAAMPPSTTGPSGAPQLAGALPTPNTPSQPVIPGQTDPHKPGFDPSAVPFHQTPEMAQPGSAGPLSGGSDGGGPPVITPTPAQPPAGIGAPPPANAQPGILHGNYKGQDYTYQAPAPTAPTGAASVPVPAPPVSPGGSLGPQGMNTTPILPQQPQGPGINPLAAALAGQGALPPSMSQMDPGMLAMALSGGAPNLGGLGAMPAEIAPPPPPMDFAAAAPMDFGGFGGFGGLFG